MKVLLWDFDGTLAQRDGMWSGALVEVLRVEAPELNVTRDDVRPHLQAGFPWHTPEVAHPGIQSSDDWWGRVIPVFVEAFASVGISRGRAEILARRVRGVYCDPTRWRLFDDTVPTLSLLAERGWSHRIVSNHVPELPDIVEALGLAGLIEAIHNSAETGYEKPHPEAFRTVLRALPGGTTVWMIGDSIAADVVGAERVGIPAILVRKISAEARICCEELASLVGVVESLQ